MAAERYPVAVLVSGTGTNLQALIDRLHVDEREATEIVLVVASSPDAAALERAATAGIPTAVVRKDDHPDRESRDRHLAEVVRGAGPELVVLAGWMSILTEAFLDAFPDRVVNLHPSLLPSFPGMHSIEDALAWGVRYTGVTVHFAEAEVDAGPPVLQEPVPVVYGDSIETLRERVRGAEHRMLCEAVRLFSQGRVSRNPDRRREVQISDEGATR